MFCSPFHFFLNKNSSVTNISFHTNLVPTDITSSIPNVILDTDIGNDIDFVLALSILYNYHKEKRINLIGITINKANRKTIPFVDILNH